MKHQDTADNSLTIRSIAGYCTELTLWNYIQDMATQIREHPVKIGMDTVLKDDSEFVIQAATQTEMEDSVWYLGQTLFHLATGLPPFGGLDLCELRDGTPVPVIPHTHFTEQLCNLIEQCLCINPLERPHLDYITEISNQQIQTFMKRKTDHSLLRVRMLPNASVLINKVHFWKETMTAIILLFMLVIPVSSFAQNDAEMEKMVRLTQSMRKQTNRQAVLNELMKDNQWTLMDELKFHSGECSNRDKVSMFGMNDIAREIARKDKGIVNHGNRFKHSADEKHPYSFVELTVKKGMEVSYKVEKHKGVQNIIVVPFDAKQAYSVKGAGARNASAQKNTDGTMQMTLTPNVKGSYTFSIKNEGKKNASFVVITYNSRK